MRKIFLVLLVMCALVVAKSYSTEPFGNPMMKFRTQNNGFRHNLFGAGGPDAYGYRWVDNDTVAPGAPVFRWIDISGVGTPVTGLGDDMVAGPFNLGFNFPYYWYRVSSFYLSSNGYIAFGDNFNAAATFANSFPNTNRPNNTVAPLMSDFDFTAGTPSCYYWTNVANDTCVISYQNVQWWNQPTSCCSLQIILSKPDSSITFQYKKIIGDSAYYAATEGLVVGIENFIGNVGLTYQFNAIPVQDSLHDNLAVKFYPPVTSSYQANDVSIWNAINQNSGGFFVFQDSSKTMWANIINSGTTTVTNCSCSVRIIDADNNVIYNQTSVIPSMVPGARDSVVFSPVWTPTNLGLYRTIFKATIADDIFRGNDSVVVETHVVTYPTELAFDDGEASQGTSWNGASGGYAVKFYPPGYPCRINGAKVSLYTNRTVAIPCTILVYLADGPDGSPGTVIARKNLSISSSQSKWYRLLMDTTINSGAFFVAVIQGDSGLLYNEDGTPPISAQTWEYTGTFAPSRNLNDYDVMMRALVGYVPLNNDVTTEQITSPLSMLAPGTIVSPQALIGNFGILNQPTIPVFMKIDSAGTNIYSGHDTISINSGEEDYANFSPQWTSGPAGNAYDITVYTTLGTDQDLSNDTIKSFVSSFTVTTWMYGKFRTINPTIDGDVQTAEWADATQYDISDMLGQRGTAMRLGSAYMWIKHDHNFVYVAATTPLDTSDTNADELGLYLDENRSSSWSTDSSEGNYWVRNCPSPIPDSLTYRAILSTTPTTYRFPDPVSGSVICCSKTNGYMQYEVAIPKGTAKDQITNARTDSTMMRLWAFALGSPNDWYGYWPQTVPGAQTWNPTAYGILVLRRPPTCDVGATNIIEPTGSVSQGLYVTPKAAVKDYSGYGSASVPVIYTITMEVGPGEYDTVYIDTAFVALDMNQEDTVEFASFHATVDIGTYLTEAKTVWVRDTGICTANDVATSSFEVTSPAAPSWTRLADILTGVAGKFVKDGGALVAAGGTKDGDVIYGFRGKSREFYSYTPNTWISEDSIPNGVKVTDPTKINKKVVAKGASMCFDGNHTIYATKGNGVPEFWAYEMTSDVGWTAKAFVPVPKGLKGGTSIIWFNGKVYLLAGNQKKTDPNNFFVYEPAGNIWTPLASLGLGPKTKVWKDGACITEVNGVIYAMKSNDKPNYFFSYDTGLNTWTQLTNDSIPPFDSLLTNGVGKLKKIYVKDGAAMVNDGSVIYATKGGGYNFVWKYTPGVGWSRSDSVPRLDKKSVVKTGGAMAYLNNAIYLLKGNNKLEFWSYYPVFLKNAVVTSGITEISSGVMTEKSVQPLRFSFSANPNPLSRMTTIRYTTPISSRVAIKLYNTTGRLIQTVYNGYLDAGSYSSTLLTTKISNGIYFLRYEDATNRADVKLIVQ